MKQSTSEEEKEKRSDASNRAKEALATIVKCDSYLLRTFKALNDRVPSSDVPRRPALPSDALRCPSIIPRIRARSAIPRRDLVGNLAGNRGRKRVERDRVATQHVSTSTCSVDVPPSRRPRDEEEPKRWYT